MEVKNEQLERILFVDDVKANLMLFEASFGNDFSISLAESGQEALKLLKAEEFAVVVSDQNMPGMTGTDLLEIVARDYPDIMRFMITAYTDYTTVVDSINKGKVYGYFNKPYNVDEVKMTINNSLELRRLKLKNQEMIIKLERLNEELVELDKTKINFLSSFTNEIKTPIQKIMTAVHMIKDRNDSNELTESLNLLDLSLGRLESFSESTKLLIKLQDSDQEIKQEEVSLKELLEVGIIEKRELFRSRNIEFTLSDEADGSKVSGDFELLLNCLMTLLELSVCHAAENSKLQLSIVAAGKELAIEIASSESSYAEKEQKMITDLFMKERVSFKKDHKLELILAHHIIFAHQGKVEMEFESSGSTRIRLNLPLAKS